jgi:hypothetical protein
MLVSLCFMRVPTRRAGAEKLECLGEIPPGNALPWLLPWRNDIKQVGQVPRLTAN